MEGRAIFKTHYYYCHRYCYYAQVCFNFVLLTVRLGIILVNNQLDAHLFSVYVYFETLHVSRNHLLIIRRLNCINTTSGIYHSMQVTVWYAGMDGTAFHPQLHEVCFNILHITTCGDEQSYFMDKFLFGSRLTGFVLRVWTTMSVAVIRC